MAYTRIAKYQAERLSRLMAEEFMKAEAAQIRARRKAAHRAVADRFFTDEVKALVAQLQAGPGAAFLRGVTDGEYMILCDMKGERFANARQYIRYSVAYDGEPRTFAIDCCGQPEVRVTKRIYDELFAAEEAETDFRQRSIDLCKELERNIIAAKTVEKLIEKWPEARSAIMTFFGHVQAATEVEQPLESLVRRYCAMPALPATVAEVEA